MKKLLIAVLSLLAVTLTMPPQAAPEAEKSLYERLGGVFAIAAVVNHFSDAVVKNPIVGKTSKNPALREWHTENLDRLAGLKFLRTLWVCEVTGGPFKYSPTKPGKTHLGLENAHRDLKISPEEFDEVAAELGRSLDVAKVPAREKGEVLAAFAAHKNEVTAGYKKQEWGATSTHPTRAGVPQAYVVVTSAENGTMRWACASQRRSRAERRLVRSVMRGACWRRGCESKHSRSR